MIYGLNYMLSGTAAIVAIGTAVSQRRHRSSTKVTWREPWKSQRRLRVLSALLAWPDGEYYGWELAQRTGLRSGTLYPILSRLQRDGWLTSEWEDAGNDRPRRRCYRLTTEGCAAAEAAVADATAHTGESLL